MKTGTIVQLVVAGIITVLALVGLSYAIYMHETNQTDEPGFMQACFNQRGLAEFDLAVCEHGQHAIGEVMWPTEEIPLTVRTSGEMPTTSLVYAIQQLNYQVGCDLFVISDESSANVIVFPNSPMQSGDHPGGSTIFRREDGVQTAYIDIYGSSSGTNVLAKVYMHELGHVLGLEHDTWQGSIMRTQQNGSVELVRVTDHDRRILRERYCTPQQ